MSELKGDPNLLADAIGSRNPSRSLAPITDPRRVHVRRTHVPLSPTSANKTLPRFAADVLSGSTWHPVSQKNKKPAGRRSRMRTPPGQRAHGSSRDLLRSNRYVIRWLIPWMMFGHRAGIPTNLPPRAKTSSRGLDSYATLRPTANGPPLSMTVLCTRVGRRRRDRSSRLRMRDTRQASSTRTSQDVIKSVPGSDT